MRHAEFEDPRLVEVYDAMCPWSRDDDFFVSVVEEAGAEHRVLDLGCGTGRLALGLAARGHSVTGVDPARASLDAARAKSGADRVTWIEGNAEHAPTASFDVAVSVEVVAIAGAEAAPTVSHRIQYGFSDGTRRVSDATLRFRSEAELRTSIATAGFTVEHIFGGWNREPIGHVDGEFLVVAMAE